MCDGGDGPGGPSGPSHGGEVGNQEGGNPSGGSGGNVGPGFEGGTGGLPTSRNDPPAFSANDVAEVVGGDGGGFYGGWEEATQLSNQGVDPTTGAFGFDSSTGAQYGSLIGMALAGVPGGLIGGLAGGLMGQSPGGGNVSDYGGADPDDGGGPTDPLGNIRPTLNPKPPGWGEISAGDFIGSIGSSPVPTASAEGGEEGLASPFALSTTPDRTSVSRRYVKDSDDDLLKTLVFGEKEFTKNLF